MIRHVVEPTEIIYDGFDGEEIQSEVRVFHYDAKSIEAQLHVRAFVVVEQAARTENNFLASLRGD